MTAAILWAAAASADPWSGVADEDSIGEEWGDGLSLRPVRSPAVLVDGVGVVGGAVQPMFGSVSAQYGARVDEGTSLGASLDARLLRADGTEGASFGVQSLGASGWLVVESDGVRHGLGLVYGEPTGMGRGWYLYHPLEGGRRLVGVYDATIDLDRFDFLIDVRIGGGNVYGAQLSGLLGGTFELEEHVALTAAVQLNAAPVSQLRLGLGVRPVDGLELDAGVAVPIWLFAQSPNRPEILPGVAAKAWF